MMNKPDLAEFFDLPQKKLIEEVLIHNQKDKLILKGTYVPGKVGTNYGFFKYVTHIDGSFLFYPVLLNEIDNIFVYTRNLERNQEYTFEVEIGKKRNRINEKNPFLLQCKVSSIKEVIELSELDSLIFVRKKEFEDLTHNFKLLDNKFKIEEQSIIDQISLVKEKEIMEANVIIEDNKKHINQQLSEIEVAESKIANLHKKVNSTNNDLLKMEKLLHTLTDRISLCKNLQFINEDDEAKYLNILTAREFNPINHLDFKKDFDKDFSKLSEHIHAYLYHKKNLIYTLYQIKNFLTLLRTHDIIVLSGLSGSGKTQIVKAFAEALGGVAKIIPVKPNWTSSDDLTGYYNPIQMTFLPTPFTEAIVEAINNPSQLYFICLDEMNLARVEYYFADFLSKLEDRNKQPEIELYANHEEELFVSEFSTLLNLVESSIQGKKIKSWQDFLDDEEARRKFFDMLGNTDKESMLQLHAKMKRRLIDILKFPSTIRIPDNVRFIGAINVDETTHYFSPKILDRIHVVKFENPLLIEDEVNHYFEYTKNEKELEPVYVRPNLFSERKEFPAVNNSGLATITQKLKKINQNFLLPLNIDFGIRSIRQSLNYAELNKSTFDNGDVFDISLNTVIIQKIFPRFIFDGSETAKDGQTKIEVVKELQKFLADEFNNFYHNYESDETDIGKSSSEYLDKMLKQADINNSQFNFFA